LEHETGMGINMGLQRFYFEAFNLRSMSSYAMLKQGYITVFAEFNIQKLTAREGGRMREEER
jgi:hypothetical protein